MSEVLGWRLEERSAQSRQRVEGVCGSPGVDSLRGCMHEADVIGDGSCWLYACMAPWGYVDHVLDERGAPRLGARGSQEAGWDWRVRERVVQWLNVHQPEWGGDVTEEIADARLQERARRQRVREGAPVYVGAGRVRMGVFGGQYEFPALARMLDVGIATIDNETESIGFFTPGGRATQWRRIRSAGARSTIQLQDVLRYCAMCEVRLVIVVYYPSHYHVLLPLRDDGSAVLQPLSAEIQRRVGIA